jgi:MFS family permease
MSGPLRRMLLVNVACMGGATLFMFLNNYLLAQGLDKRQVGFCDAGFWIISVLLQPWLGPQLDKRGRVLFLRAGVALLALAAFGYAYVPIKIAYIFPLRVLHGAGFALYLTSAWAWIADHAPPEKMHSVFGIFGLSSLAGSIVGPVAAGLIRGPHHPHQDLLVFQIAAGVFLVSALLLFTLSDAVLEPRSQTVTDESLWKLALRPRLRGPLIGSLSFGLAVGSLFAFAAPYLESLQVEKVPALFVVLTVVAGAGRAFCGSLSNRFGAAPLIAPCLMSLALGSAGLGALQWFPPPPPMALMLLAGGVAGVGYGLVYPLLNGLSYERLEAWERGRGVSLVAACIDSGNAVGAAVAGGLAQSFGTGHMFLAMGAAVAVTAILSRWSDRP